MKSRLVFVLCAAMAVGLAGASPRSDIERQYHRWAKAALTNDVDTILSVLMPDYTLHTFAGKTISHKDYEASLRKRKASNQSATAYETSIASVTVEGRIAKVISDEVSAKVSQDPITHKKVKLIHTHRYLDTWIRTHALWRLRETVTKVESTTVVPM